MTEKTIKISNVALGDAKKAIQQWIDLYSDDLPIDFKIVIHSNEKTHFIEVDKRIDNDRFYYLVNYLKYPENLIYKAQVEGYIIGKEKKLIGQDLIIYISENDTEHDNVFAVNKLNQHFKIDFGGKIKEVSDKKRFTTFQIDKSVSSAILKKKVRKNENEKDSEVDKKIHKRFKVIFLIVLFASALNLLIPYLTKDIMLFENSTWIFCMGVGLWFFMDYEMLRLESLYVKCLIISIGVIFYGYFLTSSFQTNDSNVVLASFLYPLTFLLIQWPTRRIYKTLLKREPEVDKHGKFADLIYTLILFLGLVVLPFLIVDYLK